MGLELYLVGIFDFFLWAEIWEIVLGWLFGYNFVFRIRFTVFTVSEASIYSDELFGEVRFDCFEGLGSFFGLIRIIFMNKFDHLEPYDFLNVLAWWLFSLWLRWSRKLRGASFARRFLRRWICFALLTCDIWSTRLTWSWWQLIIWSLLFLWQLFWPTSNLGHMCGTRCCLCGGVLLQRTLISIVVNTLFIILHFLFLSFNQRHSWLLA